MQQTKRRQEIKIRKRDTFTFLWTFRFHLHSPHSYCVNVVGTAVVAAAVDDEAVASSKYSEWQVKHRVPLFTRASTYRRLATCLQQAAATTTTSKRCWAKKRWSPLLFEICKQFASFLMRIYFFLQQHQQQQLCKYLCECMCACVSRRPLGKVLPTWYICCWTADQVVLFNQHKFCVVVVVTAAVRLFIIFKCSAKVYLHFL